MRASASDVAWIDQWRIVLTLIGVYLLGHFVLRLALSPTLGIDDAEQILFAQHWALGYRFRQPPLFTWLLIPVVDAVGPGVLAVSLVRYALLAITFISFYATARLCIDDRRMAALAVLSFTLIYVFAYYAHHDLTHTTALGATVGLTLYAMTRLAKTPSWLAYVMLGLTLGFGFLAKWNFVLLAVGLPLTCLLLPAYRHLVLTPKIIGTLAAMTAVSAPTALWMLDHGQTVHALSGDILASDANVQGPGLWLEGSAALIRSTFLFPLPFMAIFLILFGRSLWIGFQTPSSRFRPALTPVFFGSLMLIILALHALLIPTVGAVNFTERWMHPALMSLPILLFAVAERDPRSERRIIAFLTVVVIFVAVAVGARLYRYVDGADRCGACREFAPFAELADGLRQAGFVGGTIVADGMHLGGNLRMMFADSRVIDPDFPRRLWPDLQGPVDCLLVWRDDDERSLERRNHIKRYAYAELGLSKTASPKTGRLEAPLLGSANRRYALGYELYRGEDLGCR